MTELNALFQSIYGFPPENVVALCGAGSNRKYFRMIAKNISCIGVAGVDKDENRAFVSLAEHFRGKGLPVPEVYAVSEDGMHYIQEDLGDVSLSDSPDEQLLSKTISLLADIQFKGAEDLDFGTCYPVSSFDRRSVMFDLNYFKYCFLKPSGLEFNEVRLQDDFERFADTLLSSRVPVSQTQEEEPSLFMYRDFNARNVMIKDGNPYFIDFQGGRRGPLYYDFASFVWQARASYSDELKKTMTDSYLEALSEYIDVDRELFEVNLRPFILFRLMQVLGAYGFRGLIEQKTKFVSVIPLALKSLESQLTSEIRSDYPYMAEVLESMIGCFHIEDADERKELRVRIFSFSYKKGIPTDYSGNGGGFVFDCRAIHNPGRYEPYRKLTGKDEPVIKFLEDDGEVFAFLDNVYGMVDAHVERFIRRGFTDMMVSFGCTGGQHRSVYCAEHLASHLKEKYPEIKISLKHREQEK